MNSYALGKINAIQELLEPENDINETISSTNSDNKFVDIEDYRNTIIYDTSVLYSIEDENTVVSERSGFVLPLRIDDFASEKEMERFIKIIERMVRASFEYKLWVNYIRDVLNLEYCAITNESHSETTVEIHHHPFSLYMITKCVIFDKLNNSQKFCSFDIATEVIELHYKMKASFVPLVASLHEKFHNGFLKIPMELVHGDYKYLVDKYLHILDKEDQNIISERLKINFDNCGWYRVSNENNNENVSYWNIKYNR